MKANEAPEKLYFDVNNNLIGLYDSAILGMYSAKNTKTSIEYTRTDAFIEKACEVDLEHLEQEVKDFCYKFDDRKDKWYDMTPHDKNIMISPTWSNFVMQLAKHFFVLGLKAQKGEEV